MCVQARMDVWEKEYKSSLICECFWEHSAHTRRTSAGTSIPTTHHPLNPREQELTRQEKEKVFTSLISAKEELSQKDTASPTPLRQARTADEPSQPGNNQLSQHASG